MRIMIAEDSGLLRALLAEFFTGRGMHVTGEADTKSRVLSLVDADPPDVVVLDIRLPPGHRDEGLQAAEEIRARHPEVGLLVLSQYAETGYAVRLLERVSGGVGYLVKDRVQDGDRLLDAVRRVAAGEVVIDQKVIARMVGRRRSPDPLDRLTATERRVLGLIAEGYSNAAVARLLGCGHKAVEKHTTAISRKLGLPDSGDEARLEVNVRVLAVLTYLRSAGDRGHDGVPP